MEFNLTTPGLLFSAISLLLLAFSNRFLTIANLIRELHARYKQNPSSMLKNQIKNLQKRIEIVKNTQMLGIISFFLCVFSMFLIFAELEFWGKVVFGASLLFLMASLCLSFWEINISVHALKMQLEECEQAQENTCPKE